MGNLLIAIKCSLLYCYTLINRNSFRYAVNLLSILMAVLKTIANATQGSDFSRLYAKLCWGAVSTCDRCPER